MRVVLNINASAATRDRLRVTTSDDQERKDNGQFGSGSSGGSSKAKPKKSLNRAGHLKKAAEYEALARKADNHHEKMTLQGKAQQHRRVAGKMKK